MATSSSEESNSAPIDFNLSSFTGSNNGKTSVIYEKCPLCLRSRKTFYCRECVANGDIMHSKAKYPERFAEKKLKLFKLMKEKAKYLESCQELFERKRRHDNMQTEINQYTQKTKLLRLAIKSASEKIKKEKLELKQIYDRKETHLEFKKKQFEKLKKMKNYIKEYQNNIEKQKELLMMRQNEIKHIVRENVELLITYIFPINEISSTQSNDSNEKAISELAEAKQTNYIKGHWVFTNNFSIARELQYSIVVEPFLPGDGNYGAYPNWIKEHKDSPTIGEIEQRNPAYNIIAALTYTAQLVSILAYYLDIRLPKNLSYSEFCGHELSEQQFFHKVAKLNANILHLCLSQNVDPLILHPKQTILNLLLLLNPETSDLGRCGPIEVNQSLIESMEESLLKDLILIEESDDCKNSDEENEWETVPNLAASEFYPPPTTNYGSPPGTNSQLQPSGTTSFAGGLISAAASVASLWRAATGQK